jgi:hypothetical protein
LYNEQRGLAQSQQEVSFAEGGTVAQSSKQPSPLTKAQKRALYDLQLALERVGNKWKDKSLQQTDSEQFLEDTTEYNRAVTRAARAGLLNNKLIEDDPAVRAAKEWVTVRQRLGNREALRKARRGFEGGVKKPYSGKELALKTEIIKRMKSGKYEALTRLHKSLLADKEKYDWGSLLRGKSKESFRKLLKRLELHGYDLSDI